MSATPSATTPSAYPQSEIQNPKSEAFADLSKLLVIAQSAEDRLECLFDGGSRELNYLSGLNEGVRALWRLVAIRKSLFRLHRQIQNPDLPPAPDPKDFSQTGEEANLFGVQASACPPESSHLSSSATPATSTAAPLAATNAPEASISSKSSAPSAFANGKSWRWSSPAF